MSKSHQRTTEKNNDNHGGGPGSSHQGGSHGHAHSPRDNQGPQPNAPTNTTRSGVSGGGGERDRHHTRDPDKKS